MAGHYPAWARIATWLAFTTVACTNGAGNGAGTLSAPWEMDDCAIAAVAAADHDGPVERRKAVLDEVNSQGLRDEDYRALSETCVQLRCPAPTPSPADAPADATAPPPIDHAELGPHAPWPCATGDIL